MKKFFVIWMLLATVTGFAAEKSREQQAIDHVNEFFSYLVEDKLYSYDAEAKFFGERSLLESFLWIQAGIMRQNGYWEDDPPTESLIGHLIMRNKESFLLNGKTPDAVFCQRVRPDGGIFNVVCLFYDRFSSMEKIFNNSTTKVIVFNVNNYTDEPYIYLLESTINGQSIPLLLGFKAKYVQGRTKEELLPYFPDEELDLLLEECNMK